MTKRSFEVEEGKKITLRIETKDKFIEFNLSRRMVHQVYDLQYMIDESWETLKLNKMDKDMKVFFHIIAECVDALDEGACFTLAENGRSIKSKNKYYLSGVKPRWKKRE